MYSLKEVIESKSLVVFGASRDPMKPGSLLIFALKSTGFTGNVAGINPQGGEVHGVPLYPKLADVPFPVDLAVLIIPPAAVVQSLRDCAERGVKGVVISAEGFAESGPEGRRYQEQVREILQATGMRAFGPNTLGIVNTETGLCTSYGADPAMLKPGSIGFAAQSGIFVGALLRNISSSGIHISKGFGLGNKVDVDESDILEYLADDAQTRTIGLYVEDIRDGQRFFDIARRTTASKPILMLKGGRTLAGAHAVSSHTASLAMDDAILNGVLRQVGVIRMYSVEEFVASLIGFDWTPLPRGNLIAVVTYSGAQAIMCVDAATEAGLRLAQFSPATQERLASIMPSAYKRQNPIDTYPDSNIKGFERTTIGVAHALLEADEVDAVIFISFANNEVNPYGPIVDALKGRLTKPFFFCIAGSRTDVEETIKLLLANRLPAVPYPDMAVRALTHMVGYARRVGVAPPLGE